MPPLRQTTAGEGCLFMLASKGMEMNALLIGIVFDHRKNRGQISRLCDLFEHGSE